MDMPFITVSEVGLSVCHIYPQSSNPILKNDYDQQVIRMHAGRH